MLLFYCLLIQINASENAIDEPLDFFADIEHYQLSSISEKERFKSDCFVGCMRVFPYQWYCEPTCHSLLKVQLDQEQNQSKRSTAATTTTSTTTTSVRTTTTARTTTKRSTTLRSTIARTTQSRFTAKMKYHNEPSMKTCGKSSTLNRLTSITDDDQDQLGDNFDIGDISDLDMIDQLKALVQLETFRTFSKSNIVVNGEDVHDKNRHPWLVALRTNGGSHFCGGAILDRHHILTAAHCDFSQQYDRIVYRTIHRSNGHGELIYQVSEVINHPKAGRTSKGTWDYDFTILSLSDPLPSYAIPICLPPRNYDFSNQECILAGWGRTGTDPPEYAKLLQEARSNVNADCGPYNSLLTSASFCVGYKGRTSGCNGDSGSPLVCEMNDGSFVAAGVASWAALSCSKKTPTGFAKVSAVVDWIEKILDEK